MVSDSKTVDQKNASATVLGKQVGRNNDILKAGRDLRELKGVSHSDFKGTK